MLTRLAQREDNQSSPSQKVKPAGSDKAQLISAGAIDVDGRTLVARAARRPAALASRPIEEPFRVGDGEVDAAVALAEAERPRANRCRAARCRRRNT